MPNTLPVVSRLLLTGALAASLTATSHAVFNINVIFTTQVTDSQRNAFTQAEARWESLLTDYITQTARANITSLDISAAITPIDGRGGILGSAGPTFIINDGTYTIATDGEMEFDSADVADLETDGSFNNVILHEMAHVMGFGTLWEQNNVYEPGSFRYTGVNALRTYREEFNQPDATSIPVEQFGGPGTAEGHWAEVNPNTGTVFDPQGRPLTQELMTGFLDPDAYISRMTVEQFRDIGYVPANVAVVPEPATIGLLALGLAGLGMVKVRRRDRAK